MKSTFFILIMLSYLTGSCQPITINGKIINEDGEPVPNATIAIKGNEAQRQKGKSTTSDDAGQFTLTLRQAQGDKANDTLIITATGYEMQSFPIDPSPLTIERPITIILKQKITELDEAVVIAYGTTTRRLNTGNIIKISSEEISRQPVSNPLAALQGRVPGVVITQTSGVAGSEFKVQVRGRSSLDMNLSRNDPLIIINGVPFEQGIMNTSRITSAASNPANVSQGGLSPLNSINPSDIESIEILKDADATAIYGSRGANGVILITTKKGKAGKTKLSLGLSSGFSKITPFDGMLNTQQYVQMRREAITNDGRQPTAASDPDFMLWDSTRYTDFKKLLIGNTAYANRAQLSVSGGSATTHFLIGAGYQRQTTVYTPDFNDQVGSLNFMIDHSSADKKFTVQFSGYYSSDKNRLPVNDLTGFLDLPPNLLLYDSLGNLNWSEKGLDFDLLNISNPLSLFKRKYSSVNENLSSHLLLNYKLPGGLVFRTSLGYNVFSSDETSIFPKATIAPSSPQLPSSGFANSFTKSWIIEPQLEYNRNIAKGILTILAGSTCQNNKRKGTSISASNYTNDLLLTSIAAAGMVTASNTSEQYRYTAFFGRINYNRQNKYIINLSGRRDGSSRFGPGRQFANFGAAGAGWIFSNERWMQKLAPVISFGKIRASYGVTGNDQIGNYKFIDLWNPVSVTYQSVPGFYPNSLFNPDYNWESNKKLEAAAELGFWEDRLLVSVSFYRNRSSNQLVNYRLPSQTGYESVVRNLPAKVQNSGVEITATAKIIRSQPVTWTTYFNLTVPKNRLISFPGLAASSYATSYKEGLSLSAQYAYKYIGVDPATGIYTFRDMNGDGQITASADKQWTGNLDPVLYGGLGNDVSYKQLRLSFLFEFKKQSGSNYLAQLSASPPGTIGKNQPLIILNHWQKPGDIVPVQKYSANVVSAVSNAQRLRLAQSDGLFTDASFIRLKNVALSWSPPVKWLKAARMESADIFLQAQNLFVITHYKGSDPETQNFYVLPPLRTVVAGIQLNF